MGPHHLHMGHHTGCSHTCRDSKPQCNSGDRCRTETGVGEEAEAEGVLQGHSIMEMSRQPVGPVAKKDTWPETAPKGEGRGSRWVPIRRWVNPVVQWVLLMGPRESACGVIEPKPQVQIEGKIKTLMVDTGATYTCVYLPRSSTGKVAVGFIGQVQLMPFSAPVSIQIHKKKS